MSAPLLELIALRAGYGDVEIVRGFDLRLNPGTITTSVSYTHLTLPTICSV